MTDATQPQRLPRMIVTGEFSAGKTKLINGLVGQQVLPSNVTSTSLPPVWLIYGKDVSFRVDLDGNVHQVSGIGEVDVHDTLVFVTAVPSETLKHMDIIDTPGNSDPNIPSVCWERMVEHADMMIWCTGATQAWRQSEKSTVRDLPDTLREQGMLLITQADRIPEERQQQKLKRRVTRDASQFLSEIRMASLLDEDQVEELRTEIIALADAAAQRPGELLYSVEAAREDARRRAGADGTDEANEAADAMEDDASILAAVGSATQAPDVTPEETSAEATLEDVQADANAENRKVGLELLNVVSKIDRKRRVPRKRSPAMASLAEALGEHVETLKSQEAGQAAEPTVETDAPSEAEAPAELQPSPVSSRVLWDALAANRDDKDACVEDFIACIDQLFMPEGKKPADQDLVEAMKSAAAGALTSKTGTDELVRSLSRSAGT